VALSRPTPRSGEAIPPEPLAPYETRGVFPIRGKTPPTPLAAVPDTPAPRTSGGAEAPRRRSVPVAARPWRILFVPPTPGAKTRTINLSAWQRKLLVGTAIALVLISVSAVTTVVVGFNSPDLFTPSAELAVVRGRLQDVEDSLAAARIALADADKLVNAARPVAELPSPARRRLLVGSSSVGARTTSTDGLPVIGTITSEFASSRRHPLLKIVRPHRGLDISAPRGTNVSAPAVGRVISSGWQLQMGLTIEIQHADGVVTRYGHLRYAAVKQGDLVIKGTVIGTVGSSGITTGPHLHYEVLRHGRQVNPMRFHFPKPAAANDAPGTVPPVSQSSTGAAALEGITSSAQPASPR
jgi:murein DD-endopeptidase MepM/ murein hydrolase activator NlpD